MRARLLPLALALTAACGFPQVSYRQDDSGADGALQDDGSGAGDAEGDSAAQGDGGPGDAGGRDGAWATDSRSDAPVDASRDSVADTSTDGPLVCDQDTDTYLVKGGLCAGSDCCDTDGNAHPGQATSFTSADACGSFDYDCDGKGDPRVRHQHHVLRRQHHRVQGRAGLRRRARLRRDRRVGDVRAVGRADVRGHPRRHQPDAGVPVSPARRNRASVPPPSDDPAAFAAGVGEAVRRARQERGWTQKELAERAGLSPNYVARLERGELGPSLYVASELCAALGIDVGSLLRGGTVPARTTKRGIVG